MIHSVTTTVSAAAETTRKMDVFVLMAMSALLASPVYSLQPTYRAGKNANSQCAEPARSKDESSCLEAVRKRAEDPSAFWFGTGYATRCGSQEEKYLADCYLQHADRGDSLLGRLFANLTLDPHSLDRYLEVTYTSRPGSYKACENTYVLRETRQVALDPMAPTVMTPYEARETPTVWWRADDDKKKLYTLLFYDVGYMALQALYVNIPSNNFAEGQTILDYSGPLNPTRNDNPYVFLLYRQLGSISVQQPEKKFLTTPDQAGRELENFVQKHHLQGPVAMNWVMVTGDAYAAEAQRLRGFMNTCAHLVADAFQEEKIDFLPKDTYPKAAHDISVYVNVTYEATNISITSCCTVHSFPSKTFNLNPLGDEEVQPAHARSDVTKFVTLHKATAFPDTQRDFKGKTLTLVMADPDVPLQAFGNPKLPFLHWLVVNIRGADVASGDVVQEYMGPAPPDPKPHRYYTLLYEQARDLHPGNMDYSALNCSWDFRGRCRVDVSRMVKENNLTLVGATWMLVTFDAFVRQIYVGAGLNPACVACHGVPGYADPCPAPGSGSRRSSSAAPLSRELNSVVAGLLVWAWHLRTSLMW